jgi:hypothetical protein
MAGRPVDRRRRLASAFEEFATASSGSRSRVF